MPNLIETQYGDLKYYYGVHCQRQKLQGLHPVSYQAFCRRLDKMSLHDAIYMPRVEYNVRDCKNRAKRLYTNMADDFYRRNQILKDENVQILTFEEIQKVEDRHHIEPKVLYPKPKTMAKYNMKPKKKSIRHRFISLFK